MPRRVLYALDKMWAHRMVAALVLISSIGVIWLGVQDGRQSDCTARYNERLARAQQARAQAAEADRQALNTLVRSLVDDNTTDGREQVQRYLEKIEQTDRERAANPFPPPPPDLCKR